MTACNQKVAHLLVVTKYQRPDLNPTTQCSIILSPPPPKTYF